MSARSGPPAASGLLIGSIDFLMPQKTHTAPSLPHAARSTPPWPQTPPAARTPAPNAAVAGCKSAEEMSDRGPRLGQVVIAVHRHLLALERLHEALGASVVIGIAAAAHRQQHAATTVPKGRPAGGGHQRGYRWNSLQRYASRRCRTPSIRMNLRRRSTEYKTWYSPTRRR